MEINETNLKKISRLGMCGAYGLAMLELAEENQNVIAVTPDLTSFSGLNRFFKKYPDRLYNVGIAEQNMVGIAAGLTSEGFSVYASTYASFATTRALDQVRVMMSQMGQPVKLIGLTAGLSAGILGGTHISTGDVAQIAGIPNITIISPADALECMKVIKALIDYPKPAYVRFTGPVTSPFIYSEDYDYEIGKAVTLSEDRGADIAIVGIGAILSRCVIVAERLRKEGRKVTLINMHTVKPLDMDKLDSLVEYKYVFTVEEHSLYGGLGAAVCGYYANKEKSPRVVTIGLPDIYLEPGDYEYLVERCGLDEQGIYKMIQQYI